MVSTGIDWSGIGGMLIGVAGIAIGGVVVASSGMVVVVESGMGPRKDIGVVGRGLRKSEGEIGGRLKSSSRSISAMSLLSPAESVLSLLDNFLQVTIACG